MSQAKDRAMVGEKEEAPAWALVGQTSAVTDSWSALGH